MKNENASLKKRLEELLTKHQHLNDKRKEDNAKKEDAEDEEKGMRGVQGSESSRGDGEEVVKIMEGSEKRGETIGTQREAGVGEEHLHVQGGKDEPSNREIQIKRRGEAEGGQKERELQDKGGERQQEQTAMTSSSEIPKHFLEKNQDITSIHKALSPTSGPDMELLTNRIQEAQEEADHQAKLAQELRSKLGEQSKRTWEAEQKLLLLEAELQRLRKAAESLVDARRQIEVRTDDE